MLNDPQLKNYSVLFVAEPHAWEMEDGELCIVPTRHANWNRMTPTRRDEGRWKIRSLLWVREDIETEQIPVDSSDLTAAVLRLPNSTVLVVSVYVEGKEVRALEEATALIKSTVTEAQRKWGRIEIILAGDFNRHDALWGGDDINPHRQGEADPILWMMEDLRLASLLPRGSKTWQNGDSESTIDLILASETLAENYLHCKIHETEHGSDHRAIETRFDLEVPEKEHKSRLLFKNAPWGEIRTRIDKELSGTSRPRGTQEQADRLLKAVSEAVKGLTPLSKPSPYAKRWWTEDLSQLRKTYTTLRNQARAYRRGGSPCQQTEKDAQKAARTFHGALRKQKKAHWDEFLSEETNIWNAARFLQPEKQSAFGRLPSLKRSDGSLTKGRGEQANELLQTFFPALPEQIEEEVTERQRLTIPFKQLTQTEIEKKVFDASQWKAPGSDGLPVAVWRQVWSVVKEDVTALFRSSVEEGYLPSQWRQAKIIPLRKPGKPDYTLAKAWRPISLLSTLSKILEAVLAERLSFLAEKHGLLPQNHYGARRRRSAEQALLLLQDRIYQAWRSKRVLSLISFDVKGAYNGVHKERLAQRLTARGVPDVLTNWVKAFCGNRSATLVINGQETDNKELENPGLPQGSPLSPILFLFYNADLVQQAINNQGGSIAFVDDYTAWTIGSSAAENKTNLDRIIDKALAWEKRSGATFEGDKTAFIHFTRTKSRADNVSLWVKGQEVKPSNQIKLLGVIFDTQLRFKEHITRAAGKGMKAVLALCRMTAIPPSTARQLFIATVAPVVDYASCVWGHAAAASSNAFSTIQKIGAKAVTGAFKSVAREVAEAEASLYSVKQRYLIKAASTWVNLLTLPSDNPLQVQRIREHQRFNSPLCHLKRCAANTHKGRFETILPYAIPPWQSRIEVQTLSQSMTALSKIKEMVNRGGIGIITTVAEKKGKIGYGGASVTKDTPATPFLGFHGTREEQNPYTAELAAVAKTLDAIAGIQESTPRDIVIASKNQAMLQALSKPARQSGQRDISRIYLSKQRLEERGWRIVSIWFPASEELLLRDQLKQRVKELLSGQHDTGEGYIARTTVARRLQREIKARKSELKGVGEGIKAIDKAFPGTHTKALYTGLKKAEARALVQLRTGASRLKEYLYKIRATDSAMCDCEANTETARHFLFTCKRWDGQRTEMRTKWPGRMGNLSFFLGGRAANEVADEWQPDLAAVRAAIRYAKATGRLEPEGREAEEV